ncbi:hypothetical protein [Myceligenerans xiligouense]|uniref:Uncharacterized protein n=1 Tax=Myceligenerans xiligouense TaxID=253184 RepID=A0A3N4YKA4_9MICO|nr:hypothetical protein [Myceligenerans xiligouense]RPF21539.1 hypothetical protein EDD34_2170 [Myceligenerans xiligouense]
MNPRSHLGLREQPLPHVRITTGPTLPGWTFPLTQALTATALLTGATRTDWLTQPLLQTTLLALTALLVLRPTPTTAGILLTATAILLWTSGDGPFDPRVLWLAPLGHLLWRTTWWAARTPPTARVELAAILTGWRQTALVLAATELLALAAWGVTALPGVGPAILVGASALAALAVLALPREE